MALFGRPRRPGTSRHLRPLLWALRLRPGVAWPGRLPDFPGGRASVPRSVAPHVRAMHARVEPRAEHLQGSVARQVRALQRQAGPVATVLVRDEASAPPLGVAAFGLGGAQLAFAATFRGPREQFWQRMTLTGLALGTYALAANRSLRTIRLRPRDVALGLGSAAVLYGTFVIGDRFARRFVPGGSDQIAEIYELRSLRPKPEIAARLAFVIAPAEELFWRGLVQEAAMAAFGRWPGAAVASLAYGGVHLVTGNFTLLGAAGVRRGPQRPVDCRSGATGHGCDLVLG